MQDIFAYRILAFVSNDANDISRLEYAERREKIRQRLGNKCFYCGKRKKLTIHHIVKHPSTISLCSSIMEDEQALERGELALLCAKHHKLYHQLEKKFFPDIRKQHCADFFKSFIDGGTVKTKSYGEIRIHPKSPIKFELRNGFYDVEDILENNVSFSNFGEYMR